MLIRSQDKMTIVPIEHGYVTLSHYNSSSHIIFSVINEGDSYLTLGNYSTDEKALKVLDLIERIYGYDDVHAFVMPQDEEIEPTEITETDKDLKDALNIVNNYKKMLFGE